MKKGIVLFGVSALIAILTACSDHQTEPSQPNEQKPTEKTETETETKAENKASLTFDQTKFEAENWKMDSSHQKTITGTLMYDGKPVEGAQVAISEKRKPVTDKEGKFTMTVDANIIESEHIHIDSLEQATVNGKALDEQMKEQLSLLHEELTVYYPINILKVEANKENADLVDVQAQAVVKKGEEFPKFGVEKFRVGGVVKDAKGEPVEGATVNLRRDGVEGFTMSDPSNAKGEFVMYYIPEDDENHYFYVHIPSKGLTYTLPEGKGFMFPDDYGVNMEIRLPENGTVIDDTLENLKATTAKGALYKGVLIGLNVPKDVAYKITIPKRDGTFTVTLPKEMADTIPTFYQINYRGFHEEELKLGDTFTSDQVPKPEQDEPAAIEAKQSH